MLSCSGWFLQFVVIILFETDYCTLVRPKTIVFGRTSVLLWFFFFFLPRNLRAPSADRRKILHDARCCVQFYNPGPKFLGSLPKKFLGAKIMQNLARFRSTSKFGGEYLQNGWRYSKSVSYSFDSDSCRVRRNKSGEDRSNNLGDLDVSLYPLKAHFSEEHISAPRGCCAPKFLHALESDQVLLTHPRPGTGAPLTTFFKGESKIGLECNKGALITSELRSVAWRNFGAPLGWGVNASTKFGGTAPLKIWESKKCPKLSTFYDNFRVWSQISLESMKIATKSKRRWREGSFQCWTKKICEIWSTTNKVIRDHVDLP